MHKVHLSDKDCKKIFEDEVNYIIPPDVIIYKDKTYQYKVTGRKLDTDVVIDYFRECNSLHIGM